MMVVIANKNIDLGNDVDEFKKENYFKKYFLLYVILAFSNLSRGGSFVLKVFVCKKVFINHFRYLICFSLLQIV